MSLVSAHRTDRGLARAQNEDCVWVDEKRGGFIVADDLGGHEAERTLPRQTQASVGLR